MRRSRIVCLVLFLAVILLAVVLPRPAETDDLAGLTASARAGDIPACLLLCRLALEGIAMPQSDAAAAGWLRLAAGQGDPEAQFVYALWHDRGYCPESSPEEATAWYRRAAENGHACAAGRLAGRLLRGLGTARDPAAALRWYRRAADAGDSAARMALAKLLAAGADGIPADPEEAEYRALCAVSDDATAPDALLLLGRICRDARAPARDAAAREWFEAAAAVGSADGARTLAERIRSVFGFPTGNAAFDAEPAPERGGCVAFLDAYPEGRSELTADIATCHHSRYYKGSECEAFDNEEPNPVPFLALKRGAVFRFMLAPLRGAGGEVLDAAECWLKAALSEIGVGAKTAAGYGWFDVDRELSDRMIDEHAECLRKRAQKAAEERDAAAAAAKRAAEAEARELRAARHAAMTPQERIREWAAEWQRTNFNAVWYRKLTPEEKLELVRLFLREPEPIWKAIVLGAADAKGKKKDRERFRMLCEDLNGFRKAHAAEVGGKLKNAF